MGQTLASIRSYADADAAAVAAVWHRAGLEEYSYLPLFQALTPGAAFKVFCEVIVPDARLWVSCDGDDIAAFVAMRGSLIDRLYVDPPAQRRGHGTALLALARRESPLGLELFTHQQNTRARAFYEKHGFEAVRFGVSPAPELVPDVEYHWRPQAL